MAPDDAGTVGNEGNPAAGTEISDKLLAGSNPQRLPDRDPDLTRERKKDDLLLRKIVARGALSIMVIQVAVADGVFIKYAQANQWNLDVTAIHAWLAATVIEVISVVLVITRYLFPSEGPRD